MDIKTTLTPVLLSDAVPYTNTVLAVTIDVSSIITMLLSYDLYIVVYLIVPSEQTKTETLQYEYTKTFRRVTTLSVSFNITVLGTITDVNALTASAKGYYISQ